MMLKKIYYFTKKTQRKLYDYGLYLLYLNHFKKMLKKQHFVNKKNDGEDEYLLKWKVLHKNVESYSFRFFSNYLEKKNEIIPENIGRSYIETVLDPEIMRGYYEDKNFFPAICGAENLPKTVLCRVNNSSILDCYFKPLKGNFKDVVNKYERLILKPSVGSASGKGVLLFQRNIDGKFESYDKQITLTEEFLLHYDSNFVLQDVVKQHSDLSLFNPTSVNTLRIAVYRSWKDELPHAYACVMRVGKNGQFVDNAHAGGMFVAVDMNSGEVGKKLFDQYGNSSTVWNGLDYTEKRFIPKWECVKNFAEKIAQKIVHHRLIAMDISVDENGKPVLIEYNLGGFSYWLFMMTNQNPLGIYSDEIIEFCKIHHRE